jgi:hypothetical protein
MNFVEISPTLQNIFLPSFSRTKEQFFSMNKDGILFDIILILEDGAGMSLRIIG